jgi:hypothetical protein
MPPDKYFQWTFFYKLLARATRSLAAYRNVAGE